MRSSHLLSTPGWLVSNVLAPGSVIVPHLQGPAHHAADHEGGGLIGRRLFLAMLPSLAAGRWLKLPTRRLTEGELVPGIIQSQSDPIADIKALVAILETTPGWAPQGLIVPGDYVKLLGSDGQSYLYQIAEMYTAEGGERYKLSSA